MPWMNYTSALRRAEKSGRPLLLVFTVSGSPGEPSAKLLDALENEPACQELVLQKFSAVRIHTRLPIWHEEPEQRRVLKERFGIEGYPTMIVSPDGERCTRKLLGSPHVDSVRVFLEGTELKGSVGR